ncbi:FtsX-like permease family protein [Spirillospora sp. NPDC048911]|uniref:FtsX-like permease family protein n=1 Tax=Spirillospora sp. NPDC048911 TaxID=3364527 RepID=UPI00371594A5
MRATWRVAAAAAGRRKLQTLIIGVVVLVCTATVVLATGILATVDRPFDQAFDRVRGAHLTVSYDAGKVTAEQLSATARRPGVTAAAGPFATAVLNDAQVRSLPPGPLTVVGRAGQDGPVDRLVLTEGRWHARPGEIVIRKDPRVHCLGGDCGAVGSTIKVTGGLTLTVVGMARSVTDTADAWVDPAQIAALRPAGYQMLYRFADSSTGAAAVTSGLPRDAVTGSRSYQVARADATDNARTTVPFLMTFGVLGLLAAMLIIGNVVSGAVVSGFRHIGVLKTLGFTPAQVTAAYVVMIAAPGLAGCTLGVVAGNLLAKLIMTSLGESLDLPAPDGFALWVDVTAFLGVLAVVAITALAPALRAGRLSAAQAISAGAAPRRGRALRIQRVLSRSALPRPVSLGLGLPFARPGRSALTLAGIAFGVAAVTFACGLLWTLHAYQLGEGRADVMSVGVNTTPEDGPIPPGEREPALTGDRALAAIKALPGTGKVVSGSLVAVRMAGVSGPTNLKAYQDGLSRHGYDLVSGRWLRGGDEAVVPSAFLSKSGKKIGDTVTAESGDRKATLRIVGEAVGEDDQIITGWGTLATLEPGLRVSYFEIKVRDVDLGTYVDGLTRALGGRLAIESGDQGIPLVVTGLIALLTAGLTIVAALGVFNTVVLNTRDRIRDFGIIKSLGSTPKQIVAMVVTSMVALGLLGGLIGLPLGWLAHRIVMPITAGGAGVHLPDAYLQVYGPLATAVLISAGAAIGAFGAMIPAGWAGSLKTATALRSE